MLQSRRQDLEAQIRGLREEVEKGQGRLQATHEELLLLRRERREHSLEVTRGLRCAGTSSWDLSHCLRSSWEMRSELGHYEPQQLGHESIGINPRAGGSHGRVLSRGGILLECNRARQLGGQRGG